LTDNTILITGGGAGIGRGLARALHARGNKVIIAGRDLGVLNEVAAENSGMVAVKLDIRDAGEIQRVAKGLISQYPKLNVLMNNAGVMYRDDAAGSMDDGNVLAQINTNLIGSIRLTSALVEHLKSRPEAAIIYTASTLGFIPMAGAAVYSATKAALHSYAMSQRFQLRGTSVKVQEIDPPYVGTRLGGGNPDDQRAMTVDDFVNELLPILGSDANEIIVKLAQIYRENTGPDEYKFVVEFNEMAKREGM
jgi:uncharacterized oxidoreductase